MISSPSELEKNHMRAEGKCRNTPEADSRKPRNPTTSGRVGRFGKDGKNRIENLYPQSCKN